MIRDSVAKDLEDLMQLWLTSNIDTHHYIPIDYWLENYEMVKTAISEGVYLYEEQGELLAFLGCIDSYIAGIFVKKENRSQGIGKQLLEYAKSRYESLALDVYCSNNKAIEFYQREGFRVINAHINEETGFDEYRMEWKR